MKQLQFIFQNDTILEEDLQKIRQGIDDGRYSKVLIQIYTELVERGQIEHVCEIVGRVLPEALYAGASSNGNIVNGDFSSGSVAIVCTLFESPATKVELLQYPISPDTQESVAKRLADEIGKRPWVQAVELLATIRCMSVTTLCESLSHVRKGVQIFGGGAFSEDLAKVDACVFSNAGGYQEKGIVFILFGGDGFHVKSFFVTGWKPLGSFYDVTAADGCVLRELDHRPAYEIYHKYLHIRNDEHFFFNTLEFPFIFRYKGVDIMRAPITSNPDGSLLMTSDMIQGVKARLAYGDPWTILESVWQEGNRLLKFSPECIFVFSCAARRTFWGNKEVGKETEPYQRVAPTSGFYTSGEFLRTGDNVNPHNVTQVIAAMREGEAVEHPEKELRMAEHSFEGKVSMIQRMATFVKAKTEELEEANRKLRELAVTDVMTGIANKNAYLDKIRSLDDMIGRGEASFSVFLFDLNSLKEINDEYGHENGDQAIIDTAGVLKTVFRKEELYRIGGDEFVAITDGISQSEIERRLQDVAEKVASQDREEKPYGSLLSVSRGASAFRPGEDTKYRDVFRRADNVMYQEKASYYSEHDRRRHVGVSGS